VNDGPGATPLPITFPGLTIATTIYAGFDAGRLRPFALTGVLGLTHAQGWTTAAGIACFVLAGIAFSGAFGIELRSALSRR
jgi:hypothetical protein